jgi:hypothetical protein
MALHLIPALQHQCPVVVAVDPTKQQSPVVLAVLVFASFTSGDRYGLCNR